MKLTQEQKEFLDYLKNNYRDYLIDKVQDCYVNEVDNSFKTLINEIEQNFKK